MDGEAALEIFAGTGHLSQCWRRCERLRGIPIFELDFRFHDDHDVLRRRFFRELRELVELGKIAFLWVATPCSSFSRARDRPGGPPRLRSDDAVWGLPDLRGADELKVKKGNAAGRLTQRILALSLQHGVACVCENPSTSRLWLLPGIRALQKKGVSVLTDFCQDGQPWRKRTKLFAVNARMENVGRLCTGRGTCSRTGRQHTILRDLSGGKFLTLQAQAYPLALCRRIVQSYANSRIADWFVDLEQCGGVAPISFLGET